MKILAIDDEKLAVEMLENALKEVCPSDEVFTFRKPKELLDFAKDNACDIAFLDIKMRGMTGIELSKKLKDLMPNINIIFVTGYDDYTSDAMHLHASGYIYKPVTSEKIKYELNDLRYPIKHQNSDAILRVNCFGNFDVFTIDGAIVQFSRSKAKELFAYLVSINGASSTIKEIYSVLFEDMPYERKNKMYLQKIISSLMSNLREVNAEKVIVKSYNSMAINTKLIDCDYYNFLNYDVDAINSYHGKFMNQYSWAEFMIGYLDRKIN